VSSPVPSGRPVGATSVGGPIHRRRPLWLLLLLLLLAALVAAAIAYLVGRDDATDGAAAPASPAGTAAGAGVPAASSTSPASAGSLLAGTTDLLAGPAISADGLSGYSRRPVTATDVAVQSVPADEGFWVGSSVADRVWVQLIGGAGSGYRVRVGDRVDFAGVVAANADGFAGSVGVTASEGADQLTAQSQHVQVEKSALRLHQ